jgi:hypothetical protein
MKEELLTDALLREFLLGKVGEEECARIESLFLTDSQMREKILAVEQDLIEDYLEESLSTNDREKFVLRYEQTAAQQQQVRITKAIRSWAINQAAAPPVPVGLTVWNRLRAKLQLNPVLAIPIAVTAMVAIVCAGVWVNSRMKHGAIERELAQLNTPASLSGVLPNATSLDLSPITLRSIEQQNELKKSTATRIVELSLPWVQKERYSTYKAELRRVGGDESFTITNLPAVSDGRYAIRLRLHAQILSRGQYQILLRGISADGAAGETEEYQFAVSE